MANGQFINNKHCKDFALQWAKEMRPGWEPTQVSKQWLDDLNTLNRNKITGSIAHHPTVGKTIKYLF